MRPHAIGGRSAALSAMLLSALLVAGCDRSKIDMLRQPKLMRDDASPLFHGSANRPPPPGTQPQAMGPFAEISSGRRDADAVRERQAAEARTELPRPIPKAMLVRGQERFTIYCVPCHSVVGDGDGMVVRRGFPAPPSYHLPRLREASDRYLYDVITHGRGAMLPYADRVDPQDRWAIVAYVRALQLSRHAPLASLPPDLRDRVAAAAAPAAGARPGEWRPVAPSEARLPEVTR